MREITFKRPLQKDKMKLSIVVLDFRANKILVECDTGYADAGGQFHPVETVRISNRDEIDLEGKPTTTNYTLMLNELLPEGMLRTTFVEKAMNRVKKFLEERYGLPEESL